MLAILLFVTVATLINSFYYSHHRIQFNSRTQLQRNWRLTMKIHNPLKLQNNYFGLRHGQSTANVAGIISSTMLIGTTNHGLTDLGRSQSRNSAPELIKLIGEGQLTNTIFYSSPFKRAKETTEESMEAVNSLLKTKGSHIPRIVQVYMCGADVRQFSQHRFKNAEVRNMLDLPPPDDARSEKWWIISWLIW